MKFSLSKVNYKKSPPTLGEDTEDFLKKFDVKELKWERGNWYFIIKVKKSKEDAFFLGSAVYGVYGFTNYAILDEWNTVLMFMDILWGGTLFYSTTYIIYRLNGIKKI